MDSVDETYKIKSNTTLVFLHYFGGSKESWKWVIDALKNNYRCVALNLPGFGNSTALKHPSLENFAKHVTTELMSLGITNYILVGHSMGAKIAVKIAIDDLRQHVDELILVAPSPPGIEPIDDLEKQRMLNHPNLSEAKKTIQNITKLVLGEAQYNLAIENNLIPDNLTWNWWLNKGMHHSIANEAKDLKLPITLINSQEDPVITPDIIRDRVVSVFPDAQLVTTKKSGHLMPMELPSWVAEQIRNIIGA